jgi:hypothetical protein
MPLTSVRGERPSYLELFFFPRPGPGPLPAPVLERALGSMMMSFFAIQALVPVES